MRRVTTETSYIFEVKECSSGDVIDVRCTLGPFAQREMEW